MRWWWRFFNGGDYDHDHATGHHCAHQAGRQRRCGDRRGDARCHGDADGRLGQVGKLSCRCHHWFVPVRRDRSDCAVRAGRHGQCSRLAGHADQPERDSWYSDDQHHAAHQRDCSDDHWRQPDQVAGRYQSPAVQGHGIVDQHHGESVLGRAGRSAGRHRQHRRGSDLRSVDGRCARAGPSARSGKGQRAAQWRRATDIGGGRIERYADNAPACARCCADGGRHRKPAKRGDDRRPTGFQLAQRQRSCRAAGGIQSVLRGVDNRFRPVERKRGRL